MPSLITMLILVAISLSTMGCHFLHAPPQVTIADYPARYNRPDLQIAWKTSKREKSIVIETMLKNVQHASVSDLKLEGALWQGGKMVSKKILAFEWPIAKGEHGKFHVTLKGAPLTSEDRVYFRITYKAAEETGEKVIEFALDPNTDDVYEDQRPPR